MSLDDITHAEKPAYTTHKFLMLWACHFKTNLEKLLRVVVMEVKLVRKKELAREQSIAFVCNPFQVWGMLHNSFCKYDALSGNKDLSDLRLYLFTAERVNFTYKVSQQISNERGSIHNELKRKFLS